MHSLNHWHYIDQPLQPDCAALLENDTAKCTPVEVEPVPTHNAVWALEQAAHALKNSHADSFVHSFNLRVVAHILGDLHQPLHAVGRVSHAHPEGDRGGNMVHVNNEDVQATFQSVRRVNGKPPPPQTARPGRNNLHGVWDAAVGALSDVVYTTWPPKCATCLGVGLDDVDRVAGELLAAFPTPTDALGADWATTSRTNFADMAKESFELAKTVVYRNASDPDNGELVGMDDAHPSVTLDAAYVAKGAALCERLIAKAGWRLALLLEEVYGAHEPEVVKETASSCPPPAKADAATKPAPPPKGGLSHDELVVTCTDFCAAERQSYEDALRKAEAAGPFSDYTDDTSDGASSAGSGSGVSVLAAVALTLCGLVVGAGFAIGGTILAARVGYLHAYLPGAGVGAGGFERLPPSEAGLDL